MDTFADLPDALVRDLLNTSELVAAEVGDALQALNSSRRELRVEAKSKNLIRSKAELDVPREPSIVGVDGSYQVHRLTAVDLVASAAVAVEGTTKEARRHWEEPFHKVFASPVRHSQVTVASLRAIMIAQELELAANAPHDLVLLDGSFSSLIIYLNQGLSRIEESPDRLKSEIEMFWERGALEKLKSLLTSHRTVALPKFTSRNELVRDALLSPPIETDAKTLATLILRPGEYTTPVHIESPSNRASLTVDHLPKEWCSESDMEEVLQALRDMAVIFFKPFGWIPALRLEVPGALWRSNARLAILLEGIMRQFFSPAVIEPYPLFLADRMVKSLGAGIAAVEHCVAQSVTAQMTDAESTMLYLQKYRTEGGGGGV